MNLVFKSILVITLTVITARFSKYEDPEALYSSGSDVSVHWSSHCTQRLRKTVNSISSKYQLRKPAKTFFKTTFMVLFRNYFTKVTSQHAGSECNSTHLIEYRRVDIKTILNNEKWVPCLQSSKLSFSQRQRCRKIDWQIKFDSACLKYELLEISSQILRF